MNSWLWITESKCIHIVGCASDYTNVHILVAIGCLMHPPKTESLQKKYMKHLSISWNPLPCKVQYYDCRVDEMRRRVLKGEKLYEKLLEENATY